MCVPSVSTFFSPTASTIGFFPACCALSGLSVCGSAERLLEIGLVQLVGEDRRAFGDDRPQAARVVDVAVRVDDVLDRLVRNQPFRFGDDRERRAPRSARDSTIVMWSLKSTAIAA